MDSYGNSFAKFYDLFYSAKEYRKEALFIDEMVRRELGRGSLKLLELACGTGNHAFEFEKLGYDVMATDLSKDMIAVANEKATMRGSKIKFLVSDMCQAGEGTGPYDVIVCLFDSIGYLLENERIVNCLKNANSQLKREGLCILECWHGAAMLTKREAVRVRRWKVSGADVVRISESSCNVAEQNCLVRFEVIVLYADGTWQRFEESHRNRYFFRKEMEALFEAAGFAPLDCCPAYQFSKEISEDSWHLLHVARPRC